MNRPRVASPRYRRAARAVDPDPEWNVDAVREVWARQQEQVKARIGVIERALAVLADGQLGTDLRREAERAAHTLAGSLGMFGFIAASDAARRLEQEMATPAPASAGDLSTLLEQLQGE